jgi:urocanate hydratase
VNELVNEPIELGRGPVLRCKGWRQEGLLRMLENTLTNGEKPQQLIIYGGSGRVARDWNCYRRIVETLKNLAEDETLLVQSGKPVAVFRTSPGAPRVLTANTNLVGKWANWDHYRELERRGLMMYGQYTAGTWAYIGTQGILQGTYETFAACGKRFGPQGLKGRILVTAGLGGMGGAQPLAVKMAGGVCIAIEIDPSRIDRRIATGYCDVKAASLDDAKRLAEDAAIRGEALGIGVVGHAATSLEALLELGLAPAAVTDQTSAHDPLNGYIPDSYDVAAAIEFRSRDPKGYIDASMAAMARHMRALLAFKAQGATIFEYGNNLRGHAKEAGVANAFDMQGFVPLYIRDSFSAGRGPFRWVCLSGDADDLKATDEAARITFPKDEQLNTWFDIAQTRVPIQGLPSRTCWLGLGERDKFGLILNDMVRTGKLKGPVAMSRDHLDTGSVAQPTRETEGMLDGSDAVADWPLLNALSNAACGADLVTIHQGGGSGMGGSISAGMTIIADGSAGAADRIARCLFADPAIGVVRHADAGYPIARDTARHKGLHTPMLPE